MAETRTQLTDYGVEKDPQRLEQEISQTRSEMAGTINAIQQRLEPERLKDEAERRVGEAVDRAKDKVEDATIGRINDMTERATRKAAGWRANMVNTIKENPVPAALVGVGLGWLIMEGSGNSYDEYEHDYRGSERYPRSYGDYTYGDYGYRDSSREDAQYAMGEGQRRDRVDQMGNRIEETVDDLRERASNIREQAAERIDETGEEIRHRAEQLREDVGQQWDELREGTAMRADEIRHTARHQGRQITRSAQTMLRENPLAVGAAAVALGILVGSLLPTTETESRMVGPYRDELVDQVRHEAQHLSERAQAVASEAFGEVKDEAKEVARKAMDEVTEEGKRAAQRVSDNNA